MRPEAVSPYHVFYGIRFGKMVPLAYELPPVTIVLDPFLSSQFRINYSFSKCIVCSPYYTMFYMKIKLVNTFKELRTRLNLGPVRVQKE